MGQDPFEAPASPPVDADADMDAEAIRMALLPREGAVRMAVTPFAVIGVLGAGLGGFGLFGAEGKDRLPLAGMLIGGLILLALGKGLRDFRPWARIPALVVSVALCLGVIVSMWIVGRRPEPLLVAVLLLASMPLFLLSSKASAFLFTPDYAAIVEATPHLRYRAPASVLVSIALLIAAVLAMVWWSMEVRPGRAV